MCYGCTEITSIQEKVIVLDLHIYASE